MFLTSQKLPRRMLLRAAGCSIALPALASLRPLPFLTSALAADTDVDLRRSLQDKPRRFCCIFFPNGVSLPPEGHPAHADWHWFPHATGSDYPLTQPLQPLAEHRDVMTILSGLSHPAMRPTLAHITADSFLTGADTSRQYVNSISLDQFYASAVGSQTRFASLTLSSDGGIGTPGRTKTLSFSATGRPIPSLSEPRQIFNRLFAVEHQSLEAQRRAFGRDRSILDSVLSETQSMHRHLSAANRRRLEEYTTSVREIEQRLDRADRWLDVQRPQVDPHQFALDVNPRAGGEDYIRSILDLIYVALLTDSTRSITYQITSEDAKGIGDRFPSALGLPGHHSLSHGIGNKNGYEDWARYDQFLTRQLAYFLQRLKSTADPFADGSLLDNTIVFYGCGTSRTHVAVNYPLILAGGMKLGFRHGQHRRFDGSATRLSNLYVTMLQQLGVETDRFADSAGSLDDVLA
jgi:hypothetical protein